MNWTHNTLLPHWSILELGCARTSALRRMSCGPTLFFSRTLLKIKYSEALQSNLFEFVSSPVRKERVSCTADALGRLPWNAENESDATYPRAPKSEPRQPGQQICHETHFLYTLWLRSLNHTPKGGPTKVQHAILAAFGTKSNHYAYEYIPTKSLKFQAQELWA